MNEKGNSKEIIRYAQWRLAIRITKFMCILIVILIIGIEVFYPYHEVGTLYAPIMDIRTEIYGGRLRALATIKIGYNLYQTLELPLEIYYKLNSTTTFLKVAVNESLIFHNIMYIVEWNQ